MKKVSRIFRIKGTIKFLLSILTFFVISNVIASVGRIDFFGEITVHTELIDKSKLSNILKGKESFDLKNQDIIVRQWREEEKAIDNISLEITDMSSLDSNKINIIITSD